MSKSSILIFVFLLSLSLSKVYANPEIETLKIALKAETDPVKKWELYDQITYKYFVISLDSAILYSQEAMDYFLSKKDTSRMLRFMLKHASCHRLKGDCLASADHVKPNLQLFINHKTSDVEMACIEIAEAYRCASQMDSAFVYLHKGEAYCNSIGSKKCSQFTALKGGYFMELEDYNKAYVELIKAKAEDNFKNKLNPYVNMLHIVSILPLLNKTEEWLSSLEELNDMKVALGFGIDGAHHFEDIELEYLSEKEQISFLKDANEKAANSNNLAIQSEIIKTLAGKYYKNKSLQAFEKIFNTYTEILDYNPIKKYQVIDQYVDLLKNEGRYKDALKWSEKSNMIQDSLNQISDQKLIKELEEKYESAEKEKELASNKMQLNARTNQRNGLLSLVAILGLLSIMLFNRFRSKQKLDASKIRNLEKEKKILAMNSMLEGQETERVRIAKDLHDGLGGLLSTVKVRLTKIAKEVQKIESFNVYERTTQMVDEACDEVRRISHNLIPGSLRLAGLKTAVEHLGQELNDAHPFTLTTEVIGFEDKLDETREVYMYRIVQEGLNNIIKHADPKNVLIQLSESGHEYHITIEDDGTGFDINKNSEGLGLQSIHSRVDFLNGKMDLLSKRGEGTTLSIHIPK